MFYLLLYSVSFLFQCFFFSASLRELISFLSFCCFSHSFWRSIEVNFSLSLSFLEKVSRRTLRMHLLCCSIALARLSVRFHHMAFLSHSVYFRLIVSFFSFCVSNLFDLIFVF